MVTEIGLDIPLKGRRLTMDERDSENGINFQRFCEIMGVDVPI